MNLYERVKGRSASSSQQESRKWLDSSGNQRLSFFTSAGKKLNQSFCWNMRQFVHYSKNSGAETSHHAALKWCRFGWNESDFSALCDATAEHLGEFVAERQRLRCAVWTAPYFSATCSAQEKSVCVAHTVTEWYIPPLLSSASCVFSLLCFVPPS